MSEIADLAGKVAQRLTLRDDDAAVVEAIDALIELLGEGVAPERAKTTLEPALRLCQRLHEQAKSRYAIPLARAIHRAAQAGGDISLTRWALTTLGILVLDTGDVVGALQCYMEALRLAAKEENRARMSGLWNNMGLAACGSGGHEMATRCYQRALALLEKEEGPVFQRFIACINLASSHYKLGNVEEGLRYGERALLEMTPEFQVLDAFNVVLLRRNLIRLYVAAGRLEEARVHIEAASREARDGGPRMRIAAETARACYEVATGQNDIALTRLDKALSEARSAPAALQDTLVCAIRCEEASGNPARALLRLEELCEHVYRSNIDKARDSIRQAGLHEIHGEASDQERERERARLISQLAPPRQPEGWKALQRLGVAAAMPLDGEGWHGVRVGALTRALAEASGMPPLQAREVGLAAEVHDIGMSAVPPEILSKAGSLNASERAMVQRHSQAGAEMLSEGRHPRMLLAHEISRYHHARYDGEGYPARVGGEFIPVAARMCAVADAYDMMVCGYGGKRPRSMAEALEELRRHAGAQFDPGLIECFEDVIRSEAGGRGMDLSSDNGMGDFQELVLSLKEDRGFA